MGLRAQVHDSVLASNWVGQLGGGIFAGYQARLVGVRFHDNHASFGGAVAVLGANVTMHGCNAEWGGAIVGGGGLYVSQGEGGTGALTMSECALANNSAGWGGGGACLFLGGALEIHNSSVAYNSAAAGNGGALVVVTGGNATGNPELAALLNSTIAGSPTLEQLSADELGLVLDTALTVVATHFTGNRAEQGHGAVLHLDVPERLRLNMSEVRMEGNAAARGAGDCLYWHTANRAQEEGAAPECLSCTCDRQTESLFTTNPVTFAVHQPLGTPAPDPIGATSTEHIDPPITYVGSDPCSECVAGLDCIGGNEFVVEDGYWMAVDSASKACDGDDVQCTFDRVYECQVAAACASQERAGRQAEEVELLEQESLCRTGYATGVVLCGACSEGYEVGEDSTCIACPPLWAVMLRISFISLILLAILVLVVRIGQKVSMTQESLVQANDTRDDTASMATITKGTSGIIIGWMQVAAQSLFIFDADCIPELYGEFLGVINVFNLPITEWLAVSCLMDELQTAGVPMPDGGFYFDFYFR
eukprot:gene13374-15800_t